MAFEQKPNSGSLFKNQRKTQDNHPDMTGTLDVGGQSFWINAWTKTGKNGKFLSITVKPKDAREKSSPTPKQSFPTDEDFDSLPF